MPEASIVEILGGEACVKEMLATAITSARKKAKLSCDEVNRICLFGDYYNRPKNLPKAPHLHAFRRKPRILPRWQDIEKDSSLMRGDIFSVASLALDVPLDTAIDPAKMKDIEKRWNRKRLPLKVLYGCGSSNSKPVLKKNKIPVYLLMRILKEIN